VAKNCAWESASALSEQSVPFNVTRDVGVWVRVTLTSLTVVNVTRVLALKSRVTLTSLTVFNVTRAVL
jgi:hypothetical protein